MGTEEYRIRRLSDYRVTLVYVNMVTVLHKMVEFERCRIREVLDYRGVWLERCRIREVSG